MERAVAVICIHATAVSIDGRAALLRGPPGSGKSDLALRCLAQPSTPLTNGPAILVADDQVRIWPDAEGRLIVAPPETIRGKIEVRGLGIIEIPFASTSRLALVVDLAAHGEKIDRMPEPDHVTILENRVPRLILSPFEASAPLKLLLALTRTDTTSVHHE